MTLGLRTLSPKTRARCLLIAALAMAMPLMFANLGSATDPPQATRIYVGPYTAEAGDTVYILGVGFPALRRGDWKIGDAIVARVKTTEKGLFFTKAVVPRLADGPVGSSVEIGRFSAEHPFIVKSGGSSVPAPTTPTTTPPTTTPPTTTPPTTTPPPPPPTTTGRPTEATTGYRVPDSSLRVINGSTTASALGVGNGGTISGVRVTGQLCLDRQNVRVVDSWVEAGISVTWQCGLGPDGGAGAVIEHTTVGPASGCRDGSAVGDSKYTLRNVEIRNYTDGTRSNGAVTIESSLIWKICETPGSHSDGIQVTDTGGGGPIEIRNSVVHNPVSQTGAVTLGADTGAMDQPISIVNSYLAGGGYTLYGGWPATGYTLTVTGTAFECTYYSNVGGYGPVAYLPSPASRTTWTGNTRCGAAFAHPGSG